MARSQAKVLVTIWSSEDWLATSSAAQRLYLLMLSQSRLNLAGVIDLMPSRWATLAPDTTEEDVRACLAELVSRRFVAVDWTTEEAAIRTFAEHDVAAGALNVNLVKGFWSAWEGILSRDLRHIVVANVPDRLWQRSEKLIPAEAEQMRRSPRLEPQLQPQSEPQLPPQSEPSASVTATVTDTAVAPIVVSTTAVETPGPRAPDGARKRDPLWEAVLDQCGVDADRITPSARGAYNRAVSDLRSVGATAAEVSGRVAAYRRVYPDTALTPTALAKHWPQLDPAVAEMPRTTGHAARNQDVLNRRRSG